MQKSSFKISPLSIAGIIALVVVFACIRLFENRLFYDPLNVFFKHEGKVFPHYEPLRLFMNYALRYALNSVVSLGIMWLAFKDRQVIKLSALLYILLFIAIAGALFIVLDSDAPNKLLAFYLRRFIMHPLLLLLFLPAFYYQKHMK